MRTNFHATGHFEKPTKHRQDGATFTFRPSSFQRFSRHKASTYFLDRLFLVAFLGHNGTLSSLCARRHILVPRIVQAIVRVVLLSDKLLTAHYASCWSSVVALLAEGYLFRKARMPVVCSAPLLSLMMILLFCCCP